MILRRATPEDAPALAALEKETFGEDAWNSGMLREELVGPDRYAVVLETDGAAPVGFAVTRRAGDVVDLQRIVVRSTHRRQGLAARLLHDVTSRAYADGAEAVLLEVSVTNSAGLGFYSAAGFAEIARRPRYYRDGSAAVVLRLPLRSGHAAGRG